MYSISEHIPYICYGSAAFQSLIIHIYITIINTVQLLTGFEDNIRFVGPEDKNSA